MTSLSRLCHAYAARLRATKSPQLAMLAAIGAYDEMRSNGETLNAFDDVGPQDVIAAVAYRFAVPEKQITGAQRHRAIVRPRSVAAWVMRESLAMSWPAIARALGRKDHTSAIHLWRVAGANLDTLAVAREIDRMLGVGRVEGAAE